MTDATPTEETTPAVPAVDFSSLSGTTGMFVKTSNVKVHPNILAAASKITAEAPLTLFVTEEQTEAYRKEFDRAAKRLGTKYAYETGTVDGKSAMKISISTRKPRTPKTAPEGDATKSE